MKELSVNVIVGQDLAGSHWLLTVLPIWATAIALYVLTIGAIFFLRDRFEGLFYNTSYSAMIGDGALCAVVIMASEILKRGISLLGLMQNGWFHPAAFTAAITFGIAWWATDRPQQWGDCYHHLVVAPLLCYLGITLVPVIFGNGTKVEMVITLFLVALWAGLVAYDIGTKRLDQRKYHHLGQHLDTIKESKEGAERIFRSIARPKE